MNLQPEESISIQHAIGSDIMMQLDDVGKFFHSLCAKSAHDLTCSAHSNDGPTSGRGDVAHN